MQFYTKNFVGIISDVLSYADFSCRNCVDIIAFGVTNGPMAYKKMLEIVNFNNAEVLVQLKIGVNYKQKQDDLKMLIVWLEQIKANSELRKLIKDE